jgi:hypothetical protein
VSAAADLAALLASDETHAPRLVASHDRNNFTCASAEVESLARQQASERSEERRRADSTIRAIADRIGDIEAPQLEAVRSVLTRDPLATDRAWRLASCPPTSTPLQTGSPVRRYPCRLRCCAYCAERRARRLAKSMGERTTGYAAPLAALVTCPSKSLTDLPAALRTMQDSLAALRRRRWFASAVVAGALAIETPLTKDGHRWALHAHGVLDVPNDSATFRSRCEAEWRALVGINGAVFDFERLRSGRSLASYALKVSDAKSWAQSPRELSPQLMAHLDSALHGRRLVLSWGAR